MRAGFGLVSLLVVVGLMVLLFKMFEVPALEKGQEAHDQVQQISGRGQDGNSAMSSFKIEPQQRGSQLDALLVTDVVPGGAADTFYGLKKGDRIIAITTRAGLQKVNEASNGDPDMAKAMMQQESFAASLPIEVIRDGKQMMLPLSANPAVVSAPAASAAANGSQSPAPAAQPPQQQQPHNIWEQAQQIKQSAGQ